MLNYRLGRVPALSGAAEARHESESRVALGAQSPSLHNVTAMAALVECTATASNSTATIVSRDDGTGSTMGGDLEKQPRDAQAVPAGKETDGEVIWVDWDGPE